MGNARKRRPGCVARCRSPRHDTAAPGPTRHESCAVGEIDIPGFEWGRGGIKAQPKRGPRPESAGTVARKFVAVVLSA